MSMSVYNVVGLSCHGRFYICVSIQFHQQLVSKWSVVLFILIIGRVITIWDEVFFNLRVSFDGLVISKKVFFESSHRIKTHLDVVVGVL